VPETLEGKAEWMIGLYTSWPRGLVEWFERGAEARARARRIPPAPRPGSVLVGCGMGGSGFSLDVAAVTLSGVGVQVLVVKSHRPPPLVGPGVPVVAVSYSGRTLETILCTRESMRRGAPVAGVAGEGSPLHELLAGEGYPVTALEGGGLPRTALAQLAGAALGLLLGGEPEARGLVEGAAKTLNPGEARRLGESIAGPLARELGEGRIPVIGSCGWSSIIAYRWATELAENAGVHSILESYPEAGHNYVNAWHSEDPGRYTYIIVKANVDDELCHRLEDWLEEYYKSLGPTHVADLRGYTARSPLAAALQGAMTAGIASTLLALRLGRDPAEIPGIAAYKQALAGTP